jgi:hypothetical protein
MTKDLLTYLTQSEAATFLRTTPQTLLKWEKQGLLRACRPNKKKGRSGGLVLYVTAELIEFVEGPPSSSEDIARPRGRPRKQER